MALLGFFILDYPDSLMVGPVMGDLKCFKDLGCYLLV